jgi:hypothetical protein
MWKRYGTARQATDNSIIRCMRFSCWITKAADTLNNVAYNSVIIASPQRQWFRERVSVFRLGRYIACLGRNE